MSQVQATPVKTATRKKSARSPAAKRDGAVDDNVQRAIATVRDKLEEVVEDRTMLAVAAGAGAVGVGVGVLIGSRLARFVVYSAVSSMVRDFVGDEVRRAANRFVSDLADDDDDERASDAG